MHSVTAIAILLVQSLRRAAFSIKLERQKQMSKVLLEVTAQGLLVPPTVLEQYGWPVGTEVILESQDRLLAIRPQRLTPEAIFNLAATYLFEKVGDAVAAETPLWDGERWRVKVMLPHLQKHLGQLFFSADGKLLASESDSPARLEEIANEA